LIFGLLMGHGFAHLAGFVVAFKLHEFPEMPHSTRILNGRWDVGPRGIRVIGVLWLAAAVALGWAGIRAWIFDVTWARWALPALAFSLILSVIGLPHSKWGIGVNLAFMGALAGAWALGWIPL
jgi:hypothetical protein